MDFLSSLRAHYPDEVIRGLEGALSQERTHGLYLNSRKYDEASLLARFPFLRKHPIVPHAYWHPGEASELGKSLEHNLGAFYCMDPASMLVPYFLDPKPGERVLDYCGAPGGKTVVAAMLLGDDGAILSNDLSYPRSLETSHNVERLGLGNVAVVSGDLSLATKDYAGYFDAILLDAPCSGSAMFRKEKKMMEDWTTEKVLRCAATQIELLHNASSMLIPGGRIVYSTCSFSYEEDEAIVLAFLKEHPSFEAVPLPESPLFYRHPDLPQAVHVFPYLHPGEGQFVCLLQDRSAPEAKKEPAPHAIPKAYASFVEGLSLGPRDYLFHHDALYAMSLPLRIHKLSLIRYGLKILTDEKRVMPDHALASYLPAKGSIPLTKAQAYAYLRGETFPLNEKDGFAIVSYEGLNLGYVKLTHGVAKNHYPKGLRRDYF